MFTSRPVTYSEQRSHERKLERAMNDLTTSLHARNKTAALLAAQDLGSAYDALIRDELKKTAWQNEDKFSETVRRMVVGYRYLLSSVKGEQTLPPDLARFFQEPGTLSEAIGEIAQAAIQKKGKKEK